MPCSHCAREFSLFHRESACHNCGFGYCSSCLKHKVPSRAPASCFYSLQVLLPKTGKEHKVCSKCHALITAPKPLAPPSPPVALQKRLDKLEPSGVPRGLSHEDQRIAERLERLHQERRGEEVAVPSEHEVRLRLQKLKGTPARAPTSSPARPPDRRTDAERSHDLLQCVTAEVSLTPVLSPEQDIAARLAKLRGELPSATAPASSPASVLGFGVGLETREEKEEGLDEVARLMQKVHQDAEKEAQGALEGLKRDKAIQVLVWRKTLPTCFV